MSIASILGFLVTAVIARPSKEDRVAELEREKARLHEALSARLKELAEVTEAMSRWRDHALAARGIAPLPVQLDGQHTQSRFLELAQALAQSPQNGQMNALQVGDNYFDMSRLDMLVGFDPRLVCNCVPSRGQVWAANRAEA